MSSAHGEGYGTPSVIAILVATFVFGCVAGIILFLLNTTQEHKGASDTPQTASQSFIVTARMYGGCDRTGCESYRILENGTYTYIRRDRTLGEIRREGTVDSNTTRTLRSMLDETKLGDLEQSQFTGTCPTESDGLGYVFDIEFKGSRYTFDSCRQALEQAPLVANLTELFVKLKATNP